MIYAVYFNKIHDIIKIEKKENKHLNTLIKDVQLYNNDSSNQILVKLYSTIQKSKKIPSDDLIKKDLTGICNYTQQNYLHSKYSYIERFCKKLTI